MSHLRQLSLVAIGLTLLGVLSWWFWQDPETSQVLAQQNRQEAQRISMPEHLMALELEFRLGEDVRLPWVGSVEVSGGELIELENLSGARVLEIGANEFRVLQARTPQKKKKKKKSGAALRPTLRALLDAPPSASVTIATPDGEARVRVSQLERGTTERLLDGRLRVTRQDAGVVLTHEEVEDDHPAMAAAGDGTGWLVYVQYESGGAVNMQQVVQRDFTSLVPEGHGDRIRLRFFDGSQWHPPLSVSEGGLDVWRPVIAIDGEGRLIIAWAQKLHGDWEIASRQYDPSDGEGSWSRVRRVTRVEGSDFNVVATTDSEGTVWLAWQAWRDGRFTCLALPLDDDGDQRPLDLGIAEANNWRPSIAADNHGNVFVAWDYYTEDDSYDIALATIRGGEASTTEVASSARFEARAAVACDRQNRVWVAYEEGDQQWGKDYQGDSPERVGLPENPGFGLYVNRTVRVKCLDGDRWRQPAGDLQDAFTSGLARNRSVPRLALGSDGSMWLLVRHHLAEQGRGEAWKSYALRHDGTQWSMPRELPQSANLLDNQPALLPVDNGLLAVYSTDYRTRTQDRQQCDLLAAKLDVSSRAGQLQLEDAEAETPATMEPVHPNEQQAIGRLRQYRLEHNGQTFKLVRGEFHRHTEYTAHRDQDGLLEDSLRYALDAGRLDWMGNGDHDNGFGHEYLWWQIQKFFDMYHNPPHFVGAQTYERSVVFPSGHRNVMFAERGIRPLPRLNGRDQLFGTEEEGAPDIKLLYDYLKHFRGICAIHTSATRMGTDWRDNDPEVEPIVEIYQGHRHNYEHFGAPRAPTEQTQIGGYQPDGFVWNALEKGYRLGFQSSSDHVSTHMSYAIAVVEENSRQAIIDAFKKRHCYGATDNILLVVRSGKHLMGDEFETSDKPELDIMVHGSGPLARVHVVRDNQYVMTRELDQDQTQFRYIDMEAQSGRSYYYYVRVEQQDGNIAWASPMWITVK